MRATRTKAPALAAVPQTRDEVIRDVGRIGAITRAYAAHKAVADEAIRVAGEQLGLAIGPLAAERAELERGVQTWCEAHRAEITGGGKVKFAELGTGRVSWRSRPPKVGLRQIDAVIEAVRGLGLSQFLRTKVEINKDAMLADPDRARAIAGVTISSEGEEFVIEPAEIEVSG